MEQQGTIYGERWKSFGSAMTEDDALGGAIAAIAVIVLLSTSSWSTRRSNSSLVGGVPAIVVSVSDSDSDEE